MDLVSNENIKLLRNCIAIENAMPDATPEKKDTYNNLFHLLTTTNNPEAVVDEQDGDAADFGHYILSTSQQDILENYINLTKPYINDPIDFERFKMAMYHDFNVSRQDEDLVSSMQLEINQLEKLFRANKPATMSPSQFKSFSMQFRDIAKNIGQAKFQQYFNTKNLIIFHMLITDDENYYRIVLTLLDDEHKKSTRTFTEAVPTVNSLATYIQNLCYSYIEADKFAHTHTDLINTTTIKRQMNIFSECFAKFEQMVDLKMNISNNKIFFSANSNFLPENMPEAFGNA